MSRPGHAEDRAEVELVADPVGLDTTSVQVLEAGPTGAREVPVQVTVRDGSLRIPLARAQTQGPVVAQFRRTR